MSETEHVVFVDENSLHDRCLTLLAAIVLISISLGGIYWQFQPLPEAHAEAEPSEK